MAVNKLLKGLKNIHFVPKVDGEYGDVIRITFAKKIESKLKYEGEQEWADDRIVDSSNGYAGGEGTLTTLGLTPEEQAVLFGNSLVKGGIAVKSGDNAPEGAFLFERGKKGSSHKRLYVIYSCRCSPSGVSGETVEDGKSSAGVEEINYSIGEDENGNIYYYIDTDSDTVDQSQVTGWYTEVQFPKQVSSKEVKIKDKV